MQRNVGLATNEDELRPQSITEGHLQLLLILTIAASPMNGVNVANALSLWPCNNTVSIMTSATSLIPKTIVKELAEEELHQYHPALGSSVVLPKEV